MTMDGSIDRHLGHVQINLDRMVVFEVKCTGRPVRNWLEKKIGLLGKPWDPIFPVRLPKLELKLGFRSILTAIGSRMLSPDR